jgi:hypothetical protein
MGLAIIFSEMKILNVPFTGLKNSGKVIMTSIMNGAFFDNFGPPTMRHLNTFLANNFSNSTVSLFKRSIELLVIGPSKHLISYSICYSFIYSRCGYQRLSFLQTLNSHISALFLGWAEKKVDLLTSDFLKNKIVARLDKENGALKPLNYFLICLFKALLRYPFKFLKIRADILDTGFLCFNDIKNGLSEFSINLRSKTLKRNTTTDFYKGFEMYTLLILLQSVIKLLALGPVPIVRNLGYKNVF